MNRTLHLSRAHFSMREALTGLVFAALVLTPRLAEAQDCGWVQRTAANGGPPINRVAHAMGYDPIRERVVLFGGTHNDVPICTLNDTWLWNGTAWQLAASTGPSPRANSNPLVFHPELGALLMFGGGEVNPDCVSPGSTARDDTWAWDGSAWMELVVPGPKPSPRYAHAMAYDSVRHRVVLFGGRDGTTQTNGHFGDTWEWDGSAWAFRCNTGPSPRQQPAMAYAGNGKIILFGGYVANPCCAFYDDTWQWDGVSWTQLAPASRPLARAGHVMMYDSRRGRVILFGGDANAQRGDTWEWDGTKWYPRNIPGPGARDNFAGAYDFARDQHIIFGGNPNGYTNDTWAYRPPALITQQPMSQSAVGGQTVTFAAFATGNGPVSYRWRRNGQDLTDDGHHSGTGTPVLSISNVVAADNGIYSVRVTDDCGNILSDEATLQVFCVADVDDGSFEGRPDGGVTIDDLLYYLFRFEGGC